MEGRASSRDEENAPIMTPKDIIDEINESFESHCRDRRRAASDVYGTVPGTETGKAAYHVRRTWYNGIWPAGGYRRQDWKSG